jgi:hypothetical protein
LKLRLLHYSAEPFVFDPERKYEEANYGFKPVGLWLSVEGDDDWRSWCEGEQFNLESMKHVSEVILKSDANVLLIDTVEALDAFNSRYGKEVHGMRSIDWSAVKAAYDGLVIAPYHWSRRHDFIWYYGWDCASGVIWNMRAIEKVDSSSTSAE